MKIFDYRRDIGLTYNGEIRTTVSGFKCARWGFALKKLSQSGTIKKKNVIGGVRHNNCRNPDGDVNGPWCFIMDPQASSNWEYCHIEECDRDEYYNYDDDDNYDDNDEQYDEGWATSFFIFRSIDMPVYTLRWGPVTGRSLVFWQNPWHFSDK